MHTYCIVAQQVASHPSSTCASPIPVPHLLAAPPPPPPPPPRGHTHMHTHTQTHTHTPAQSAAAAAAAALPAAALAAAAPPGAVAPPPPPPPPLAAAAHKRNPGRVRWCGWRGQRQGCQPKVMLPTCMCGNASPSLARAVAARTCGATAPASTRMLPPYPACMGAKGKRRLRTGTVAAWHPGVCQTRA